MVRYNQVLGVYVIICAYIVIVVFITELNILRLSPLIREYLSLVPYYDMVRMLKHVLFAVIILITYRHFFN